MVCCVVDCPNKFNIKRRCYTFPRTNYKSEFLHELAEKRLKAWISALRIISPCPEILSLQRVCSKHFNKGRPAQLTDENDPDWVPCKNLGFGINRVCELALKRKLNFSKKHGQHLPINLDVEESIETSENIEESLDISENIEVSLEISESDYFGGDGNEYDEPDMKYVPVTSAPEIHSILNTAQNSSRQSKVKRMNLQPVKTTSSSELGVAETTAESNKVFIPETINPLALQERTIKLNEMYLHKLKRELKYKEEILEMYEKKQRDFEVKHKACINSYETRIKDYDLELKALKIKLRIHDISFEALKNDDEKVKNLTGLPHFGVLSKLFEVIEDDLHENSKSRFKKFDFFVITLMKLRMDLPISYLSYVFGVSSLTISRGFRDNLAIMNMKLGPLIKWPDDETLLSNTPSCFKEIMGNKCIILIHFLEILIKNLKPPVRGLQSMKHSIRYLMAFTTGGEIIYVSQGFGSSATNESIIEESGFLDKITEQHIVLSVKEMFEDGQRDNEQIQRIKHMAKQTEDKVLDILKDNFRILFNRQPVNSNGEVYSEFTVKCCCALANLQMPELIEVDSKEVAETIVVHTKQQKEEPV